MTSSARKENKMSLKDYISTFTPPTEDQLKEMALSFVKEAKPKEYHKMKKSGELGEYQRLKAKFAREEAEGLMSVGIWDQEAWNRAIRSQILESETD